MSGHDGGPADAPREAWVPVALSRDIAPGTAAGTRVDAAEIALWRDADGRAHAWEDRCPHRGMRLSFGFVRGDHIACLYHGWQYDAAGQCRFIPAHPTLEVPKSICVRTYALAEAGAMVWVSLAPSPPPPPQGGPATPVRSLYIGRPLAAVEAALAARSPLGGPARIEGARATLAGEAGPLVVGLHSVAPDCSALHIALAGEAEPAALAALSRQAEALRRACEAAR